MKESLQKRIEKARTLLAASDCILIGGGSGLSSAAGLTYSGERFAQNFAEFIERYCMTDMYTAGFYPFRKKNGRTGRGISFSTAGSRRLWRCIETF